MLRKFFDRKVARIARQWRAALAVYAVTVLALACAAVVAAYDKGLQP